MKIHNTILVTMATSLEEGDLFAREFLGTVIAGQILSVRHYAYELNGAELDYMKDNNFGELYLEGGDYVQLGGPSQCLVFFTRRELGQKEIGQSMNHMFVDLNQAFAVFPSTVAKKPAEMVQECGE